MHPTKDLIPFNTHMAFSCSLGWDDCPLNNITCVLNQTETKKDNTLCRTFIGMTSVVIVLKVQNNKIAKVQKYCNEKM